MWLFVVFVFTTKAVVIITSEILNTFAYVFHEGNVLVILLADKKIQINKK